VPGSRPKDIAALLAQLDSKRFADREQAVAKLHKLGSSAVPALEKALDGNLTLEVRQRVEQVLAKHNNVPFPGEVLRQVRVLDLLEMLATLDAVGLLESLARDETESWLGSEAMATLERVRRRTGG
jgi:hypothetical protein